MGAEQNYDVAVVGAGVFGAWTAYYLQRSGKRVVLIDAYGAANSRASSGDESRIIRMGYGADEIYSRSALWSLRRWQDLGERSGEPLFHQTGVLWLAYDGDPYPVRTFETLVKLGVSVSKLTPAETKAQFPQLATDGISWALLEPESGMLSARHAVQTVVREAVKSGVEYLQASVPPPLPQRFDGIITGSGARISAGGYVFACGAWLPKLFPSLLGDRIHPTRQEIFYFSAPSGARFQPPALPTWIDFKNEAYGLPDVAGRGVKVAIDRHGPAFDPDTGDRVAGAEGLAEVRRYLARRIPELKDAPVNEARVCQYENTSNGDFLLDRHPELENVWLVGGGSGHGFKHGPFVGEYVARRIAGIEEEVEPRFSLATKASERRRKVY